MNAEEFLKAGKPLKDVPPAERSREVCEVAIQQNGENLEHVPLPLRTVRLTKLAVGTKPKAYRFAPAGVRADYDLATFALRRGGLVVWERIPEQIIDFELCKAGVKGCGALLKVIPVRFKTFELCKLAFTQGGADLKDVPQEFLKDSDFWSGVALKHIPDEHKTYDLCVSGVRKCGNFLQYVPDDLKDIILCKAALAENSWAYRFVPARYHANEFLQAAYASARAAGAPYDIETLDRKVSA